MRWQEWLSRCCFGLSVGLFAVATQAAVTVVIDDVEHQVSMSDSLTLGSLFSSWEIARTDRVRWYRQSHRKTQAKLVEMCTAQVEQLTPVRYRLRDLALRDPSIVKQTLIELVNSFEVTGRVLEYGQLDPVRIRNLPKLQRRLRAGDRLEISTHRTAVVWTWDAVTGYQTRPHAPTNTAYAYGADIVAKGRSRGDFAYVIDPHGQVSRVGIARYNRSTTAVAPGSLVFYPPPGFGRSEQSAFQCIAKALAFQAYWDVPTKPWWSR